ncbi:MAG: hypothetical protein H6780_03440 [Candidatus Nomurabacteria bacterium]|nr:MAG: hypothetical protein H6780_03440 [Candidatus Nomurabacteria bacterium]
MWLKKYGVYGVVFMIVFVFLLCAKYPFANFSGTRDSYYHTGHSMAYKFHTPFNYPQLTYLNEYPSDPWWGYHQLLALSYTGLEQGDIKAIVTRTILLHIFLSSLLIVSITLLAVEYYRHMQPLYKRLLRVHSIPDAQTIISAATVAKVVLPVLFFLTSLLFLYRATFMERPHVLMIMFVVMGMYFLLKRQYWWLSLMAVLSVLCYSMSLFIFLPATVTLVGWLLVDRSKTGLVEAMKPFWYTVFGFVIGVLLHPASWGYLLNGVFFHAFAILQSFSWFIDSELSVLGIPGEMMYNKSLTFSAPLVILTTVFTGIVWHRLVSGRKEFQVLSRQHRSLFTIEAGFSVVALALGLASFFVLRTAEYSSPFLSVGFVAFFFGFLLPVLKLLHEKIIEDKSEFSSFYRQAVRVSVVWYRSSLLRGLFVVCICLLIVSVFTYGKTRANLYPMDRLLGANNFLAGEEGRGVILGNDFASYAQGSFQTPDHLYAQGMDPRMTYFFDEQVGFCVNAFLRAVRTDGVHFDGDACMPEVVERFNITHFLLDGTDATDSVLNYYEERLNLELVYQDEKYPQVKVYRVE